MVSDSGAGLPPDRFARRTRRAPGLGENYDNGTTRYACRLPPLLVRDDLLVCALLVAPMVASQLGGNYWVRVIDFALLYIMLALGLNIVVGYTGLLDMGFIAFTPSAHIRPRCWPRRICWTSSRF